MIDSEKILLPHLRQYRREYGKSFVVGYDRAGIERVFATLQKMAYEDGWNDAVATIGGKLDEMERNNG